MMNQKAFALLSLLSIFFSTSIFSQNTQVIRGTVIDGETHNALPFSNVMLTDIVGIGAVTDSIGNFTLKQVPLGRHTLQISYLGYLPKNMSVLVNSGKSTFLLVELSIDVNTLGEVVIVRKDVNKAESLNKIATTGVKTFSVEESERYAGSLGDPSRMVRNYAGVASAGDSRNDIVIRGNSPYGLLWRINGVDVTNPNHFGSKGSTGGPVTILNNNLLTNSDFFTGAFPAEYGNAFSGVFDLKMRKGNNQKFEKTFQIGFNGFELGLEGPIKKNKSSFMMAYRYSTLDVFDKLGINLKINGIPKYQDLTFKADVPTKKMGVFSFVMLGGLSAINIKRGDIQQNSEQALWDIGNENNKIITFLNHKIKVGDNSTLSSYVSLSVDRSKNVLDTTQTKNKKFLYALIDESDDMLSFGTIYRRRVGKNNIEAGLRVYKNGIDYIDSVYREETSKYYKRTDIKRNDLWQMQNYVQWKHSFSNQFYISSGVNFNYLPFNSTYAIDPRAGLSYKASNHTIGFGYGLVSKALPFFTYFIRDEVTSKLNNHDLGYYRSHQFSISDNWVISTNFRIKIEPYYQKLFNIPVDEIPSYFSMINFGAEYFQERPKKLTNDGEGENYGVEFTIEKFLSNNWYFLSTTSLFKSQYKASDKIWRNSQFNNGYMTNLVGGYEFVLNSKMRLQFNNKLTIAGGRPLKEYNVDGTINNSEVFTRDSNVYFRDDVRVSFVMNYGKTTNEFAIDMQNVTSHQNEYLRNFNKKTKKEEISYQMGFFPVVTYRLTF